MKDTAKVLPLSKTLTLVFIFFFCAVLGGFAQETIQGVIRDFAGTVEVKRAGSEVWENARKGLTLAGSTTISTGFRSTAVIELGSSLLTVRPLTRLTLLELSRIQDAEKVEFNLETGRIKAEVKSPEAGKADFTVRSSSATASVRGTVFEFDGKTLLVDEGAVEFSGGNDSKVIIDAERSSYIDEQTQRAVSPEATSMQDLKPSVPFTSWAVTAPEAINIPDIPVPPGQSNEKTGEVGVTIIF